MAEEKQQPKTTLQQLYDIQTVETAHAITDADHVEVIATMRDGNNRALGLPAGHYIIVRVTIRPTSKPGLYGVVAPKA